MKEDGEYAKENIGLVWKNVRTELEIFGKSLGGIYWMSGKTQWNKWKSRVEKYWNLLDEWKNTVEKYSGIVEK